jgi:hypothetical protein
MLRASKNVEYLDVDAALDRGYFEGAIGYTRSACGDGWTIVYPSGMCPHVIVCYQFELNNLCVRRLD